MRVSVLGAGRSAGYLIEYLTTLVGVKISSLSVFDLSFDLLWTDFPKSDKVNYSVVNLGDSQNLEKIVSDSQLLVSMMPPAFHVQVAQLCLEFNAHLFTASYVSDAMKELHGQAQAKKLVFMNELGLDPGIDHLSASKFIQDLKNKGAKITSFKSYCGGLIDKDSEGHNPWKYKITWNPMNVVKAGQGGISRWREDGLEKQVLPEQLFKQAQSFATQTGEEFDAYPNRDSLSYESVYHLEETKTLIRGTLRRRGYCEAWQWLVDAKATQSLSFDQLGCLPLEGEHFGQWLHRLAVQEQRSLDLFESDSIRIKIDFLELDRFEILVTDATPADVLLRVISDKWKLSPGDKDEVVMVHLTEYEWDGKSWQLESVLKVTGEGSGRSAMAKTVGLPLALGVELLINNEIGEFGVLIPVFKPWGDVLLDRLNDHGLEFVHRNFPQSNQ